MRKGTLLLAAMILMFVLGCAARQPAGQDQPAAAKGEGPNVVFYTFPDIPVPKEMNLQREKSFIYETPSVKAGVLVLTGNIDVASLETYFKVNMAKNGWRFVNSYKYGDVILNFMKDDRSSSIRTSRDAFTTQVEIWVGPVDRQTPAPPPKGNDFR